MSENELLQTISDDLYCQVHSDHSLEEKWLEVVCGVTNDVEEDGRHVNRHEGTLNFMMNEH